MILSPIRLMRRTARWTCYSLSLCAVLACAQRSDAPLDSTAAAQTPATPTVLTVDPQGIGTIRTGWTIAQLNTALGDSIEPNYEYNPTCTHVVPTGFPGGVRLMIVSDTVARVEVDSAGVRTAEGAGVGDTEASVIERYAGRTEVMPHKYTGPEGHYVVVRVPNDTLHQIIFETDGQQVLRYRAGRLPAVRFVEGCS